MNTALDMLNELTPYAWPAALTVVTLRIIGAVELAGLLNRNERAARRRQRQTLAERIAPYTATAAPARPERPHHDNSAHSIRVP